PVDRSADVGDHLVRLPVDKFTRDLIRLGDLEDERSKLSQTARGNVARVERTGEGDGVGRTEMGRNEPLEHRVRATAVRSPRGGGAGGEPEGARAIHHVAAHRAERGKARLAPVRRDTDAVHARATSDGDAPPTLRTGAQDRIRVVPDYDLGRPPAF